MRASLLFGKAGRHGLFARSWRSPKKSAGKNIQTLQLSLAPSFVDIRKLATDKSARLAGINVGAPARPLPSADFGLIGLAVMGQNLILNAADKGYTVCAYNRTTAKVDRFLDNEAKGKWLSKYDVTSWCGVPEH